jgi:hypothetical protein
LVQFRVDGGNRGNRSFGDDRRPPLHSSRNCGARSGCHGFW